MFELHDSPARPVMADAPMELPINILLAFPDYVASDPNAPLFNLPAAMDQLLGRFGWERASKIIAPQVWAPGWDLDRVRRFSTARFGGGRPFVPPEAAEDLMAERFPGPGASADESGSRPTYDIVHVTGSLGWRDGPALMLSESLGQWMHALELLKALHDAETRLLILQVPGRELATARELAAAVVERNGPAVLVVRIDASQVDSYFTHVIAGIIHNELLSHLCVPDPALPDEDVEAHLFRGEGGDDLFHLTPWLENLRARAKELASEIESVPQPLLARRAEAISADLPRRLHRAQREVLEATLHDTAERFVSLKEDVEQARGEVENELHFAHESGGAEPLSRIAELIPRMEKAVETAKDAFDKLGAEVEEAESHAPRVLNANLAHPGTASEPGRVLKPDEPVIAGYEYDLLVDIGPRWDKVPSLVTGSIDFPEEALPPDRDGHVIDVVFMSADFKPAECRGQLWLPRGTGRSRPLSDGNDSVGPREGDAGPLALRIRAPGVEDHRGRKRVTGRLLLYYEDNLLQSARVDVGLSLKAPDDDSLDAARLTPGSQPNEIRVDYVLSGTFSRIAQRYARRRLALGPNDLSGSHKLRLNLTLNDDPSGTHRILIRGEDLPPAWTAYDPASARKSLKRARRALLACYWSRDGWGEFQLDGHGRKIPAFGPEGGKTRREFGSDLFHLARIGKRLYKEMLLSVRPEGMSVVEWEGALRERLAEPGVIQVSRIQSTPTQYAFPWALLYEYPMPSPSHRWNWCRVVKEEWSEDGIRNGPLQESCPYQNESWHAEDILCPYGFWGLKHVVEQPLAADALDDRTTMAEWRAVSGEDLPLAIGWTRDDSLDLADIDRHVERIQTLRRLRLADARPNPAHDRDTVSAVLSEAALAYFICHCENDEREEEPFLWVGPRDDSPNGKIYASTVMEWARSSLQEWYRRRPFVFINGCHSGNLEPGEIMNFVSAFRIAGVEGVIGTEVSVKLDLATSVGERLLEAILRSTDRGSAPVGQALREVRWRLAARGNLLGLCYSYYGLADLHLLTEGRPLSGGH